MKDKQKQAVALLGRLIREKKINDEEYMLLMENVLEDRFIYYPTYPQTPPITWQDWKVTSDGTTITTTSENLYPHKEFQGG